MNVCMLQGIGRRLIRVEAGGGERKKRITKFKESAWKFVYYLSAEIVTLGVTYNEPWFTKTTNFWIGPDHQRWPDQKMK